MKNNVFLKEINFIERENNVLICTASIDINIVNVDIDLDKLISFLILKKDNLLKLFGRDNLDKRLFSRLLHARLQKYVYEGQHCIIEEITNLVEEEENELKNSLETLYSKKSFYSFLAEVLQFLIIYEIYEGEVIICETMSSQGIHQIQTGIDNMFYIESTNELILGEAKFYKSLSHGITSINKSMTSEIGGKYEHLCNLLDSPKYIKDVQTNVLEFVSKTDNILHGFVLSDNDDQTLEKSKSLLNSAKATNVFKKEFGEFFGTDIDASISKCVFINLKCSTKEKLIHTFVEELINEIRS